MRVVSLGSGSSGNALLVQAGQAAVLVDAGFARKQLVVRLHQAGIRRGALGAILLTHEHTDHACGARELAHDWSVPLLADPRTIDAVVAQRPRTSGVSLSPPERIELRLGCATTLSGMEIRSFAVSHDAVAPCGYVLSTPAWCVAVLTDSGMISEEMIEALRPAHLLVIESNHDVQMLHRGPYPWHLKQRILGPTGHLSNEQTSQALLRILDDGPRWVWLAHLSRTNNRPELARTHVHERLRANGLRHIVARSLPPQLGPEWDSSRLWGAEQPRLSDTHSVAPSPIEGQGAARDPDVAAEDGVRVAVRPTGSPAPEVRM